MLNTLRTRLVLSHLLPILLIVPLLSMLLLYLLETRYVLSNAATELAVQGELVAQLTQSNWQSWKNPDQARPLLAELQVQVPARILLVDRNGNLMVASGVATASTEVAIDSPNPELVRMALTGQVAQQIHSSAVDVAVPVVNAEEEVVGAVQLSRRIDQLGNQLSVLRWTVVGTFVAGMLLAGLLSFSLTRSVNRPLEQLTQATRSVRFDREPQLVPESGPQEVQTLARTFNGMAARLFELEQGRQRLLRSVVHELGRPLGAIKAAAQVLRQRGDRDPELVEELATGIDEQIDQLRRVLDDMALLAQSEVQELNLVLEPVDLDAVVQEECRRIRSRMESKGITLHCQSAGPLLWVHADPVRLSQILGNLLDNAQKYTPQGGQVTVSTQRQDQSAIVFVADNGPGIPAEERENIFRFFYRSPNQSRVEDGMGIGLALARRLAEAQHGVLTLIDTPDPGAVFVLRLPLVLEALAEK